MEGRLDYVVLMVLAITSGGLYLLLQYFLGSTHDLREPPVVKPIIPFVGHILGLMQYKLRYFDRVK